MLPPVAPPAGKGAVVRFVVLRRREQLSGAPGQYPVWRWSAHWHQGDVRVESMAALVHTHLRQRRHSPPGGGRSQRDEL